MRKALGVWSFLAFRVVFANSFWRVVRRGIHQGLDLEEGRERGVEASIIVIRAEGAEENHWASELEEGAFGGGGVSQSLSLP